MKTKARNYEMDMCEGPLLPKMMAFTMPLICANALSLCYNAADTIVIGRFGGSDAMAAVGSTTYLIALMTNLFIGMAVGTNVMVARYFGAKKEEDMQETLHTSVAFGLLCGVALALAGFFFSKGLLELTNAPKEVLDLAALYMKIYFLGMPAFMFCGFGNSAIRAVGDTMRPLLYGTISGILNVILNLIFVVGFHLSVAGVAWATTISQYVSAFMLLYRLLHIEGGCHLDVSKIRICRKKLWQIITIGVPVGIQNSLFSFSNVLIQSTINSFGSLAMAGSSAATNLENFANVVMNSFYTTALCFTSQNLGGRKYERIPKILKCCLGIAIVSGIGFGGIIYLFREPLLGIYTADAEVIAYGIRRMKWMCVPCFIIGIMNTLSSMLRGMGYGTLPMVIAVVGTCGLRILWLYTFYAWNPTWDVLFMGYPISWAITAGMNMIAYVVVWRRRNYMNLSSQ